MKFQKEVQNLIFAIDENIVDYFILLPKLFSMPKGKKNNYIRGRIRRFEENDERIVIEILENFDFVHKRYLNDFYDIRFEVNHEIFQLQHHALSFLKSEHLYNVLIENKLYHQRPKFEAHVWNHNLKYDPIMYTYFWRIIFNRFG